VLYMWRAPRIVSRVHFEPFSREMAILLNNIFLGILCLAVLIGTLYPLILDALGAGKISVGPPYFDFIFAVIGIPLAALIGMGTLLRWKKDRFPRVSKTMAACIGLSTITGLVVPLFMPFYSFGAALGIAVGTMVILFNFKSLAEQCQTGRRLLGLVHTPRSIYGMLIAHVGIGTFIIGVTMTNTYSIEQDIRMGPGDKHLVNDYEFVFNGTHLHAGPNYQAVRGTFDVRKDDQTISVLKPEKRTYLVQQNPMTEAAIDPGLTRDLYVALGEPLHDNNQDNNHENNQNNDIWAVRIYYKPFVRWIWLGAFIMALGGGLAASDKRYRSRRIRAPAPSTEVPTGQAA